MLGDSPLVSYYRQAKHYHIGGGNTPISRVVIHDMEYPERPDGAEWCADFFAGSGAPVASAHYCVDNNSVAQCVRESDTAYHAPPNRYAIGIEHAGYSAQSRPDWLDDYSQAELKLSAKLVAEICTRHNVPVVKLSPRDLLDGKRGICGHVDVSNAWHQTDHGDPGPNFPWDTYLHWVNEAMNGGDDEVVTPEEIEAIADKVMEKLKPWFTQAIAEGVKGRHDPKDYGKVYAALKKHLGLA